MTDTEKKRLPEVEAFIAAVDKAHQEFHEVYQNLCDMYPDRYTYGEERERQQQQAFECQLTEYQERWTRSDDAAWERLAASDDKLLAWIGNNCRDYESEARDVLRILPATLDELEELAIRNGWCGRYDTLRDEATRAGVLPKAPPTTPALQAVLDFVEDEFGPSRRSRANLTKLLDALVEETKYEAMQAGPAVTG